MRVLSVYAHSISTKRTTQKQSILLDGRRAKKLDFPPLMAAAGKKKPTNLQFVSRERDKSSFDSEPMFEFDEADQVWNNNCTNRDVSPDHQARSAPRPFSTPRVNQSRVKSAQRSDRGGETARSLPVNIPDWAKILRDESRRVNRRSREDEDGGDDDDDDEEHEEEEERRFDRMVKVPPHEYLAKQLERKQIASFSVREGVGRTLKGRDLSRVRDAIWAKTGFQD